MKKSRTKTKARNQTKRGLLSEEILRVPYYCDINDILPKIRIVPDLLILLELKKIKPFRIINLV